VACVSVRSERVFKTAWFTRAARKALIDDEELCKAICQVMQGQADDLGGGVYKKRLDKNRQRSIILAKGGRCWVYAYLFAKKDQANISQQELIGFRSFADLYGAKSESDIAMEVSIGALVEICRDDG